MKSKRYTQDDVDRLEKQLTLEEAVERAAMAAKQESEALHRRAQDQVFKTRALLIQATQCVSSRKS